MDINRIPPPAFLAKKLICLEIEERHLQAWPCSALLPYEGVTLNAEGEGWAGVHCWRPVPRLSILPRPQIPTY